MQDLGGLITDVIGQEVVESVFRFTLAGKRALIANELQYYHPPPYLCQIPTSRRLLERYFFS